MKGNFINPKYFHFMFIYKTRPPGLPGGRAAFSIHFLNMRFSRAIARLSTLITMKMPHMPSSITFSD